MKKLFYLSTCSTNKRIMNEWNAPDDVELIEIKTHGISEAQLEEMKERSGDYESLFSRRSMKYRGLGLHEKTLGEADYKKWILEEYTFLKRPVLMIDDKIFVGNAKKEVLAAKIALDELK